VALAGFSLGLVVFQLKTMHGGGGGNIFAPLGAGQVTLGCPRIFGRRDFPFFPELHPPPTCSRGSEIPGGGPTASVHMGKHDKRGPIPSVGCFVVFRGGAGEEKNKPRFPVFKFRYPWQEGLHVGQRGRSVSLGPAGRGRLSRGAKRGDPPIIRFPFRGWDQNHKVIFEGAFFFGGKTATGKACFDHRPDKLAWRLGNVCSRFRELTRQERPSLGTEKNFEKKIVGGFLGAQSGPGKAEGAGAKT